MGLGKLLFVTGGMANLGVSALHVAIVFIGPRGYEYFGAAELAPLAEQGSPVPALLTLALAALFAAFGFYALAGAGLVRFRLPLLTLGLVSIGILYTLRGLLLVAEIPIWASGDPRLPFRELAFSSASLLVGVAYLAGTLLEWRNIRARRASPA